MNTKTILFLSGPLSVLLIIVSYVGLFVPGFYSAETLNWEVQAFGQDMFDLFLVMPCLLLTSVLAYRNNRVAISLWGGVVLYLTYTFVLYCFNVHFNQLFLLYCLCLGLSFYGFIYFILEQYKQSIGVRFEKSPASSVVGVYFILIASLFFFLWLSEIVPAILQNTIPKSVVDAGLFTNGVQVLDLAIILPGILITGIFLLKGKSLGFIMAPMFLTFFILMNITIATLAVVMNRMGIESDMFLTVIMSVLAIISLVLLIWYLRSTKAIAVNGG